MSEKKKPAAGKPAGKDVIYVDADDEITGIIDKVRGSGHKIVALVLPKRSATLQSIVNMKLLKRTADEAKKNIVLITTEAGLLPLAGSVGFHVAKNLQSKPEVPEAPAKDDAPDTVEETDDGQESESKLDTNKTIGELAGAAALGSALDDEIELDEEDGSKEPDSKDKDKTAKGKNKKLKIPNFNRFRLLIVLGVLGIGIFIAMAYVALVALPKATIVIKTDSTAVNSSATVILKTGDAVSVDVEAGIVPVHKQEVKKTVSEQVNATGQQNNGSKASGEVAIRNCTDAAITIPAGGGVNSNGLTFITQSALTLAAGNFTSGGTCKNNGSHIGSVDVVAQQGGAKYNLAADATFAVAGYSSAVTGTGTVMTGGTDDIIKIVSQADIDSATQKIGAQDTTAVKDELKTGLIDGGYLPIESSFNTAAAETKSSVKAGDKADKVTVTQTITYTMLGVKKEDLEKIISKGVADRIDLNKQTILDYGLSEATFTLQEQKPDGAIILMQTTVVAGPDLDNGAIRQQVAGKKAGDAQNIIKGYPGVTDVSVEYSPFWVSSIPKNVNKITITVEEPQVPSEPDDAQTPESP